MALRKHDSVVVLEVISAFALIGTFAIALMLFFVHKDLASMSSSKAPAPVMAEKTANEKVSIADLDPALLGEINKSFSILNASQQQSQAQIGFYLGKVLQKQFSKEELKAMDEELKAQIEAAQAQAKAAAEKAQNAGTPPAQTPPAAAPAQ